MEALRCRFCGCTPEVARAFDEGYALGHAAGDADVSATAQLARRAGSGRWAAVVCTGGLVGAMVALAAPPRALEPPPPPDGLSAHGSCLGNVGELERDLEVLWRRQTGPAVVEGSRAPVREALTIADRAAADLSEALYDARACAQNRVPGCVDYMPARLHAARTRAAEAAELLEARIRASRFSKPPDPIENR